MHVKLAIYVAIYAQTICFIWLISKYVSCETQSCNKFPLEQCYPTILTPQAAEEIVLEASWRTSRLKSND